MKLHTTVFTLLVPLAGCGGPQLPPEQRTDAAISRIQVHEANLSRGHAIVERDDADCADRCGAAHDVCEEQSHICDVAREIADADAITRCNQATDVCESDRQRVADGCGCNTHHDT